MSIKINQFYLKKYYAKNQTNLNTTKLVNNNYKSYPTNYHL